jgi:hypothetical protein
MAPVLSIECNTDSSDAQVGGLIFLVWCDKVPMNAESIKIKDMFVEILIPSIGKLCDPGVFYTSNVARVMWLALFFTSQQPTWIMLSWPFLCVQ